MYEDWKSRSIEDVGLSVRVSNCLRRNVENKNDLTVGRFSKMTILEIRRMRGIGEVALNEIKFRFNALGVTLIDDRLKEVEKEMKLVRKKAIIERLHEISAELERGLWNSIVSDDKNEIYKVCGNTRLQLRTLCREVMGIQPLGVDD